MILQASTSLAKIYLRRDPLNVFRERLEVDNVPWWVANGKKADGDRGFPDTIYHPEN